MYLLLLGQLPDRVEGADADALELLVDLLLRPEEVREALDPLEVRHGHAAAVREDVRNHEDALLEQDVVRLGRRRTVRALRADFRLNPRGVFRRDHVLERARAEDVHLELEELLVRDLLLPGEADDGTCLLLVRGALPRIEPLVAVDAALGVRDGDNLAAELVVGQAGIMVARFAE